jgi:hypothetical protein
LDSRKPSTRKVKNDKIKLAQATPKAIAIKAAGGNAIGRAYLRIIDQFPR